MNRATIPLLCAAALLIGAGCASQPKAKFVSSGDPIADAKALMKAAPTNDLVLWQYKIGTLCLRAGLYDEAKTYFDEALARINGIMGPDKTAAAARSTFKAESKKTFIGEPYERVMANFYRGVLYWRDGEVDNARACFINAQFQDSDAGLALLQDAPQKKVASAKDPKTEAKDSAKPEQTETFACDYVVFDYLDGWTKTAMKGDGSDAFKRAAELAKGRSLPAYDAAAKVIVFAEYGIGPTKFSTGKYNEQLRFKPGISTTGSARLKIGEKTIELQPYDNINFQASTRGGRAMDCVLKNKAVFKSTTSTVGDVAMIAGAGTVAGSSYSGNSAGGYAGLGLMVFGLASKAISAAANPAADIRCWDNLPANLSFAAVSLPAGRHSGTVEFLDSASSVVLTKELTFEVRDTTADTVVFVSDRMK